MDMRKMYRVQSTVSVDDGLNTKNLPVKRVLISDDGEIAFNPNSDKYIYFSRSKNHHLYYLYSRFFKIVKEELVWAKRLDSYKHLGLPDDFRVFTFHTNVNVDMVKDVQSFFNNYLPKKSLEAIQLQYMDSFGKMFEECSVYNVKKKEKLSCPEISDPHVVDGAYGINDAWLDLLNCCTVQTNSARVDFDQMFSYIIDTAYKGRVSRQLLKHVLEDNPYLLDISKEMAYTTLSNPTFFDKNNANRIVTNLEVIEQEELFNPNREEIYKGYFDDKKRELKSELREIKSEMGE